MTAKNAPLTAREALGQSAPADLAGLPGAAFLDALDRFPVGVLVLDKARRVRFMNRRLESMTGILRHEACGLPCGHVLRSAACVRRCPVAAGGDSPSLDTDIVTRGRRKVPVRLSVVELDAGLGQGFYMELIEDVSRLKEAEKRLAAPFGAGSLLGRSREMERLLGLIPVLAQSDAPVLITGETGSGKDLVAEALHMASPRSREPFLRVNVSPMPEALIESELFGHKQGAFPWAEADKPGVFQSAGRGTVYLAEIGDLPPPQQAKLLKLLDHGLTFPVGAAEGVKAAARLMVATNRDPEELVRQGRLREDLLRRLGAMRLHLPALRERSGDVEYLLRHFLGTYAAALRKEVTGYAPKALRILLDYPWPGNVRELKNVVEYAVMVCSGQLVLPLHLPQHVSQHVSQHAQARPAKAGRPRRSAP
ncbi:MAG: sigma 54-interacting transcriptional regulator [Thermodesulfobacteriota bacterium]